MRSLVFACALIVARPVSGQDAASKPSLARPEKIFTGHGADVYDVAFSPDGKLSATASFDRTIKVWNTNSGTEVATLEGHEGKVFSVVFAPSGRRLLSAGEDKTLRLWDAPSSGAHTVLPTDAGIEEIALSGDGRFLVSVAADRSVTVWDRGRLGVVGSEPLARLEGSEAPVRAVAVVPDGSLVAVGGEEDRIRIWDLSSLVAPRKQPAAGSVALIPEGAVWRYAKGRKAPPDGWHAPGFDDSKWSAGASGFGYSSNADELRTVRTRLDDMGGGEGYLGFFARAKFGLDDPARIEDLKLRILYDDAFVVWLNGEEVGRANVDGAPPAFNAAAKAAGEPSAVEIDLNPHRGKLRAGDNVLAIQGHNASTSSSDFVLTPSLGARLKDAPPAEKKGPEVVVKTIDGAGKTRALDLSADGARVAAVSGTTVRIFEVGGPGTSAALESEAAVTAVRFIDARTVATGGEDGTVTLRSLDDGKILHRLEGHEGLVLALALRADRAQMASGGADGKVRIWDPAKGALVREIPAHETPVLSLAYTPDGERLITGAEDGTLGVWRVEDGAVVATFRNSGKVRSVAGTVDGSYYALATEGVVEWRPVSTGSIRTFTGHGGVVHSGVFSPDGATAASAGSDKTVRLWNVANGSQIRSIDAHASSVYCVAYRPAGDLLASGGLDTRVKLWNPETGDGVMVLEGHGEGVFALAFSRDGAFLFSCSPDGTIRRWSVEEGSQVAVYDRHPGWVVGLAIGPSDKEIVSVDYGGHLMTFRVDDGKVLRHVRIEPSVPVVYDMALSPDGEWILSANRAGSAFLLRRSP